MKKTRALRRPQPILAACLLACACLLGAGVAVAAKPAASIPAQKLIQPSDLAALLKSAPASKPLILQVGFKTMFDQARIPGAEFVGPGSTSAGLQLLRDRVAKLAKDTDIVIYCGCCPWERCPNVAAAYDALDELGFTRVRALYVANNFGADWVEKGYPTAR
jgi:thiosulfate/3-mercaptopyruvate sulfurtransferase